jgi:RES domain-containing protein
MIVYRITTEEWSKKLTASGYPARWNSRGNFMIYTAESRALACLENLVHRSGEGNSALYKVMVIDIPDSLTIEITKVKKLKPDWNSMANYPYCQSIGDKWLQAAESVVLKVPSSVIKPEFNFLLNPNHADFKKIKLAGVESFNFDERF